MIELSKIRKVYKMGEDLEVLKGVDLSIKQGEFVAIMGPSGSGKSTLMHIIGFLDRPTTGRYFICGKDVTDLGDSELAYLRSRVIGFVFQQFNLLSKMTALENVCLPQIYLKDVDYEKGKRLLEKVGLGDRMHHKPNQLSGGQQQRVAIARALVNDPLVVLADEPTGNLASDQSEEIMNIFTKLNEEGKTVIIVTHEPDIASYAKRIIKIKDGKIYEDIDNSKEKKNEAKDCSDVDLGNSKFNIQEFFENIKSSFKSIISNKVRSFLTMLGIIIGVASLIAMLAVGYGAQKVIQQSMSSLGANLLMIFPGQMTSGGISSGRGDVSRLRPEYAKTLKARLPYITNYDLNVVGNVQAVYREKNTRTWVTGTTVNYPAMRNAFPYYGRFFTEEENKELKKVCVIGQTVVNDLFGDEDPVGKQIKINRKNFTVIGVLPMKGAAGMRDQDDVIIVPVNTAMKVIFGKDYVDLIWVEVESSDYVDKAMEDIPKTMRDIMNVPSFKEDPVSVFNLSDIKNMLTQTTKTFSLLLGIIAGISLIVGGIGIMNIMLVSVVERTKEIGLRKAIGATNRAVLWQFLIEAVIVSVFGGVIGIGIGSGIALILGKFTGWSVYIPPIAVIMSFSFSAIVGIVFGFWPAKKASALEPIEALRYE